MLITICHVVYGEFSVVKPVVGQLFAPKGDDDMLTGGLEWELNSMATGEEPHHMIHPFLVEGLMRKTVLRGLKGAE